MKGFLVVLLILMFAFSANAGWEFVKYFPNATQDFSITGINNGLVVDKLGRVWLQTQATKDSLLGTDGLWKKHGEIFVFNLDGSQASFSPIKIYSGAGIQDTLGTSGYGLALDSDGNIISVCPSSRLYRINYLTGAAMTKVISPIPGYTSSMVCPAVDAAGEVFVGPVAGGTGMGLVILNADFTSAGTTIDANTAGYARAIAVTPDGKDVYFPNFGSQYTLKYHSDNGSLGPYTLVDTVLKGLDVETTVWDKKGQLWVTGGNAVSGLPTDTRYTGYSWYAWDPVSKTIKDSINWHGDVSVDPRPRGIAFSSTGDTVWVAAFNANDSCVQMFKKGPAGVRQEPGIVATTFNLEQNYPNPFNPTTEIKFSVSTSGQTTLRVFDLLGREVSTLVNERLNAGVYTATFNASNLPSGTYFYTLSLEGRQISRKMMLLK